MLDKVAEEQEPCGCLSFLITQGYKYPFYQSIGFNSRTMALTVNPWCVKLQKETPTGKPSNRDSKTLLLNHCPICGQKIHRLDESTEEAVHPVTGEKTHEPKES